MRENEAVKIERVANGYFVQTVSWDDGAGRDTRTLVFESLDSLLDWLRKHFTDESSTEKVEPGVTVRRAS